ncbi:MAG: hypothetical protein LBH26_00345 [Treponema sp.]|jgi:hypothetical protein|nr:hypothetical protein [Treponema sp.]
MAFDVENIVENIDFTMGMENMPLTDEEKERLRDCLNRTVDVDKILFVAKGLIPRSPLTRSRGSFRAFLGY